MNKKGVSDMILFFGFLFTASVMLVFIFGGVKLFYNNTYDFKSVESADLLVKVKECVSVKGDEIFAESFSINECGLNEEVLKKDHLIVISRDEKQFIFGVYDYQTRCLFEAEAENLPECAFGSQNGYEIITASSQDSRRIIR